MTMCLYLLLFRGTGWLVDHVLVFVIILGDRVAC